MNVLKHDNKIIETNLPKKTNYQLIYDQNKDYLDDTIIEYLGLNKITYKEFFEKVEEVAKSFESMNIKKGDTVTIMAPGTLEVIYLLYALSYSGVRGNFVNFMFPKEDIDGQIRKSNSKILFLFEDFYDHFYNDLSKESKENTVIIKSTDSLVGVVKQVKRLESFINRKFKKKNDITKNKDLMMWDEFINKGEIIKNIKPVEYDKEHVSYIYNTSRSSGVTKAVELTEATLNKVAIEHEAAEFLFNRGETVLASLPPFLGIFSSVLVHMPLYLGVKLIVDPTVNKENAAEKSIKYKPTYSVLPTTWYYEFVTNKKAQTADFSDTKLFVSAGFTPSLKKEIEFSEFIRERGCEFGLAAGYSFTEGGSAGVLSPFSGKVLGSAGVTLPFTNLKVFDENLKELKNNKEGEFYFYYDGLMKGYFNNKEETASVFVRDEQNRRWYKSNDIGLIDDDGNVFVHGRKNSLKFKNKFNEEDYLFNYDRLLEGKEFSIVRTSPYDTSDGQVYISHIAVSKDQEEDMDNVLKLVDSRTEEISNNKHLYRFFDEEKTPLGMTGKPLPEEMFIHTDNLIEAFTHKKLRLVKDDYINKLKEEKPKVKTK